jgi:signal transduction histidine kinase
VLYLRQRRKAAGALLLFCLIFVVTFWLYHLPVEAVLYPAMLCFVLFIIFILIDFRKMHKKHALLQDMKTLPVAMISDFPETGGIEEQDYQDLIRRLCAQQANLETVMNGRYADMVDYYTVWVHQIKTPIASMRLTLQNEDSAVARKLSADLFRIEQYVEMVLMFLRLRSSSTDYVFKEYDLDAIIRQSVKKFAGEFIGKKIRLKYEPAYQRVITDEKWLAFVIEQLLSNALKYTPAEGIIKIYLNKPKTLCIEDSGIGIAPEDLPRIFEKGYTGYNGRGDKKASGIGLFLCKSICGKLGHKISASSCLDSGTIISINLMQDTLQAE